MIRQLGPPHIFFTKSVNETGMIHLIKALKQKDENRIISYTDVIMMSKSQRTKLIRKYPIDVVQHLDCVFRHHINTMKKEMSLGEYHIEDYFYRVEFQQRGSAHIHCLFWVQKNSGETPPEVMMGKELRDKLRSESETREDEDQSEGGQQFKSIYERQDFEVVKYFNSIISATSTHDYVDKEAIQFQKHKHKDSCYKS